MNQFDDYLKSFDSGDKVDQSRVSPFDEYLNNFDNNTEQESIGNTNRLEPENGNGLVDAFKGGVQTLIGNSKAAGNAYLGDNKSVVDNSFEVSEATKTIDQKEFMSNLQARMDKSDKTIWDGLKNVFGAIWDEPIGAGHEMVAQLPNSGAVLTGMAAGAVAGSMVLGPVGTIVGGIIGMFGGNTLIETGAKAVERAQDGVFTEAERMDTMREGAIKGGVITAVDAATLGISKFILSSPGRAVERAINKSLVSRGVDITRKEAVETAMQNKDIAKFVVDSGKAALKEATTKGKNVRRGLAGFTNETAGEGIGEYSGEMAASGDASITDAILESVMSAPLSLTELRVAKELGKEGVNTGIVRKANGVDTTGATDAEGFFGEDPATTGQEESDLPAEDAAAKDNDIKTKNPPPSVMSDGINLGEKFRNTGEPLKPVNSRVKQNRMIDWENDDLATVIRKMGGLNVDNGDWRGRLKTLNNTKVFGLPGIEQTNGKGLTLDQLTEALSEGDYLNLKDEYGNYDSSLLHDYLSRIEDGEKVWLNSTDPNHLVEQQSREDAAAEELSLKNQQLEEDFYSQNESRIADIVNNLTDFNAIASEYHGSNAEFFNAKSMDELLREASNIDPVAAESIANSPKDDSAVAVELINLINSKGGQNGLSVKTVTQENQTGNEPAGLQAQAKPESNTGSETGGEKAGISGTGKTEQNGVKANEQESIPDKEKTETVGVKNNPVNTRDNQDSSTGETTGQSEVLPTKTTEQPVTEQPGDKENTKPTQKIGNSDFVPTHELNDGTQVVAVPDEVNVWEDKSGDQYEESNVSKITETATPTATPLAKNGVKTQTEIDQAANEAATSPKNDLPEPTNNQIEAGNYKKGRVKVNGIDVAIENPKGSVRSGTDKNGKNWSVELKNHYGYIPGTKGADGDPVDVFLTDRASKAGTIFVIDQIDPDTKAFDEHKVIMGPVNKEGAHREYLKNYEKNWKGAGAITEMDFDEFKEWVSDKNKTKKPVAYVNKTETLITEDKSESSAIEVRTSKSPVVVTKRFTNILNKELEKAGVDNTHQDITLHFRDPKYSKTSGGYQPVEISITPEGKINYITDYYYQGGDMIKDLDFDFENKVFYQDAAYQMSGGKRGDSPIFAGRGLYKIWQKNFSDYYDNGVYEVEVRSDQTEENLSNGNNTSPEPAPKPPKGKLDTAADNIDAEIESLGAELAELFKDQAGKLNSGVDPKILAVGAKLGALYVAKGAVTFAQYSRSIINHMRKLGVDPELVKPALKELYGATQMNVNDQLFEKMDDARTVRQYNLDNLDNKEESEQIKDFPDAYYEALKDGTAPKNNNDVRRFLRILDNKEPTQARMKEAQEGIELAMVRYARDVVRKGKSTQNTYNNLVDLYKNQPLLNIRTSTSIGNQAYSTPAPIAYLASELSRITDKSTVYEPSAGNGMLLIGADLKKSKANELNDDRIKNLKALGLKPTQGDAVTAIADGRIKANSVDAMITNPPFGGLKGKTEKDGYTLTKIDHLIAAEALDAMKDDGRATLIIGANKKAGTMAETDRIFFNWLYSHYNVADNFEIDGKLYNRQGAGWPIRVITIAGRNKSNQLSPDAATIDRVGDWNELFTRFKQARTESEMVVSDNSGVKNTGVNGNNDVSTGNKPDISKPNGNEDIRTDGQGGTRGTRKPGNSIATGTKGKNSDRPNNTGKPSNTDGRSPVSTEPDRLGTGKPGTTGKPNTGKGSRGNNLDGRSKPDEPVGSDYQIPYESQSEAGADGALVPVNMSTPMRKALDRIDKEVGGIDEYVRDKLGYDSIDEMNKALMGLQIDSVASAIYNIEKGEGIVIADQTGIGKGRQAAAILRYARKEGKTPVFVTVKADLFTDMYGDLKDIGVNDSSPLLMNADGEVTDRETGNKLFKNKKVNHRSILSEMVETGELPDGSDMLFMTYSQINKANLQQQVLSALAPNAILVLDESHNAGGSSNTGVFMQGVLAESAGVTYLSATYAKRPDNLPLYLKTSISKAVDGINELVDAVSAGGLGLQTVVSNMLTEAGQLFRRERSFDGVEINTKTDTSNRTKHTVLADSVTKRLRAITAADNAFHSLQVKSMDKEQKREGKRIVGAGNKSMAGVDHSKFSSVAHNAIRQFVLALKADTTANDVIASIKRGEKPVVALENTMGSFLSEYQKDLGIGVDEDLTDFDYRTVLSRALDRSRRVTVKDTRGNKTTVDVPLSDLAPEVRRLFDAAQEEIDNLDVEDIPVSPIDWIRHRVNEAGYSIKEITGRDFMVDYSNGGSVLASKTKEEKDRVLTRDTFNNGGLDAIILNVAGSTGISLHASEKFKDQRLRHMIVAQPALDINVFMQMLGRVHRTGQVRVPSYSILNLDIPAEIRPTSVLSKKMKSLNANTSSNTDSDTSVETLDIINKYGDQVVSSYLNENTELRDRLNLSSGDAEMPDIAMKATGRLALLPVEDQIRFYEDIEPEYKSLLEFLDSTGQNELEIKTLPLDAKKVSSIELSPARDSESVFGQPSTLVEYDVKRQGKPMVYTEIEASIKKELDGKTVEDYSNDILYSMLNDAKKLEESYKKSIETLQKELSETDVSKEKVRASISRSIDNFRGLISRLEIDRETMRRRIYKDFKVGNMVRLRVADQSYIGIVGEINHKNKKGSPYALSKTKMTFYVNDASRVLRIPLSKLVAGTEPIYEGVQNLQSIEEVFSHEAASLSRENRYIVTGNLLSAYSELKTSGQVVSFFNHSGEVNQGILLPRSFDPVDHVKQDISMQTPGAVINFLRDKSSDTDISKTGVASRDQTIRVVQDGINQIKILVPRSKAKGGKWFLDKVLTGITGDFITERGSSLMSVSVSGRAMTDALQHVMSKNGLYAPQSYADEARPYITGNTAERRPNTRFRRKSPNKHSVLSKEDLSSIIKRIAPSLKGSNGTNASGVVISPDFESMPKAIKDEARKQGSNGDDVYGVIHKGKIYINQENMTNRQIVEGVLFHEATHKGLDAILGDKNIRDAMTKLMLAIGGPAKFNALADSFGIDLSAYREGMKQTAKDGTFVFTKKQREQILMEELLAHIGEKGSKSLKLKAQELIGFIRDWLRKQGYFELSKLGATDLAYLAKSAREAGLGNKVSKRGDIRFMVAWHGSPHDHNKFSTQHIGTGEGAQVYGWGLYFSGKKEVAEFYRKALSNGGALDKIIYKGKALDHPGDINDDHEYVASIIGHDGRESAKKQFINDGYMDLAKLVDSIPDKDIKVIRKGNLYQVELAPKDNEYLRWDEPFNRQPKNIQAAIIKATGKSAEYIEGLEMYGQNIYKWLERNVSEPGPIAKRALSALNIDPYSAEAGSINNDELASKYLHAIGVRGIKYLDGGSRLNGGGSFNYVIFDDSDVSIEAKFSRKQDIEKLHKEVDAAYESGNLDLAEELDVKLNEMYENYENELFGLDESGDQSRQVKGTESEADLEKDLAQRYYDLFINENSYEYDLPVDEKADTLRAVLQDYAWRNGGLNSDVTNEQIIDAANDAYEHQNSLTSPMFSRKPGESKPEKSIVRSILDFQPVDKIFRAPFSRFLDHHGKFKPGVIAENKIEDLIKNSKTGVGFIDKGLETVRHGVIDRYQTPNEFINREQEAIREQRKYEGKAIEYIKDLAEKIQDPNEWKLVKAMLEGEDVGVRSWNELAAPVRRAIDEMGRDAVDLGLITAETYEKNKGSYLHRVYKKHEVSTTGVGRLTTNIGRSIKKKIQGSALKRRGMSFKIDQERLLRDAPVNWFGLKKHIKIADKRLVKKKFVLLELFNDAGEKNNKLDVGEGGPARKLKHRVWWPADTAIPSKFAEYDNRGTWEVTNTTGNKLEVWRDYTKAERESMGEILDARYVIAKTFHVLAHDISTARFFDDIAKHEEWTWHEDSVPPNSEDATNRWKIHSYANTDWVKVPVTTIKGTKVKTYGKLAGKYIKAELWRDIQGLESMHTQSYWREIMTMFKLNKTARNPVVHMNNVMSNMILMDLIDVRVTDLVDGYKEYVNQGEHYQEALDSGAFGHNFVSQEIRDKVLEPALKEIMDQEESRHTEAGQVEGWMRVMSAIEKAYRVAKKADNFIVEKYQIEDEIFRMATYMRRRSLGDTAQQAATLARDQFLNYDIRAPWVNAARKTVLPFISYSYRAIPALTASIAHRPWKAAKYITVMYMLNALAYMATGDDGEDEDRERASMDESKQGYTWLGFPRMQRMPWKDENNNPDYLDVRRWVPAGDVFDMNQGAIPFLPAWLQMGGPLLIAGEIVANKNTYFDREIYNDTTDTKSEAALKSAIYGIQSMIPSAPWIPGSHYFTQLLEASMGSTNWRGIERDGWQTLFSSFGVKINSVDVDAGFAYQAMAISKEYNALRFQLKQIEKQNKQGKFFNFRYESKRDNLLRKIEKLKGLAKELQMKKAS